MSTTDTPPKKKIRQALVELSQDLNNAATRSHAEAGEHAIKALGGDTDAREAARDCLAFKAAYGLASAKVDNLRRNLERGEFDMSL
jgi:hypothetical protein